MKSIKRILSLLLVLCLILSIFASCKNAKNDQDAGQDNEITQTPDNGANENQPPVDNTDYSYIGKNLIYIIGDGMGFNHIENAKLYAGVESFAFEKYYAGDVTTHSASDAVTDSAASATALATGTKTSNNFVGMDPEYNRLQNIMELSKKYGRRTAIVTTDALSGATPAGFSAHHYNRNGEYDIMRGQAEGAVDLLIGCFDDTYQGHFERIFGSTEYVYTETAEELFAMSNESKILANIQNVDSTFNPDNTDTVLLKSLVEYALDYLTENNERAFTLMVEGAYIDKHSHNNDIMKMIYAVLDLNEAVEYILDWASERDDTVIIFTADHETGALSKADSSGGIANSLYSSKNHSAANVPLFLVNTSTTLTTLDNTDVYKLAYEAVAGKK